MKEVQLYKYNEEKFEANKSYTLEDFEKENFKEGYNVWWMNLHGLHNKEFVTKTFDYFNIHRLTREDILELYERPKAEAYDTYLFVTLKAVYLEKRGLRTEQISFIVSDNVLVSYQERVGDLYQEIRNRIENNLGVVRKRSVDYLLYLLFDATLRGYHTALESLQEEIDQMEASMDVSGNIDYLKMINYKRDQLKSLKKSVIPVRDQINKLLGNIDTFIDVSNHPYFNDIKDQVLYLIDEIDSERADLESLTNLYFASQSQRSNEIMQFLTITAAIFIPITFIAGVYGMNFKHIPELEAENGYYIFWGVILTVTILLILYFKRKKWL